MDSLQGSSLKVILKIKKGKGFSYISYPVVIVAALNGVKLETDKMSPCEAPVFNAELTWEVEKNYLRRLRQTNIAFKIECFIDLNEEKRDKMGYIFLSLRQAQIISFLSDIKENETWHNFLGVPRRLKVWNPQILLVFKIQEASTGGECKNVKLSQNKLAPLPLKMEESRNSNYLQIGPSKLCTKFYELCIDINETGSLSSIISPNDIGTPLKIQFHIMGLSLMTKEFYAFQGILNKEKFKLQIKSEIQFLAAYFKQFPLLTFYLICGKKLIGSGSVSLQDLTDLREHFTASCKEKIALKPSDGKEAHITDSLSPFLKVEVTLVPMLSKTEGVTDLINEINNDELPVTIVQPQPSFSLQKLEEKLNHSDEVGQEPQNKEPSISCGLIPEIQLPNDTEKGEIENTSQKLSIFERSVENSPELTFPICGTSELLNLKKDEEFPEAVKDCVNGNINVPKDTQIIGNSCHHHNSPHAYNPSSMGSPHACNQSSVGCSPTIGNALPKIYVQELATKYIEELEDWKEKQQEMYKFELKRKTDKHLSRLSLEWTKRQQSLENELTDRLENCQSLKSRLEEVLIELEIKIENLNKLEQELLIGKNELDRRYTMKFRELRKASKLHQRDMEEKIKRSELEKIEFKNKLKEKDCEIARLQQIIASESQTRLSVEETKKMVAAKELLEQKLLQALQEKDYFKEQYNITIQECGRLREKREDENKWRLKKDKEGLQIIGLVEEINNEVDEMRKDQSTLNALRNEIIKYGVNA